MQASDRGFALAPGTGRIYHPVQETVTEQGAGPMPYFGAHMSIAGGYYKALDAAAALGMTACQLFTKNNNQWRAKPLSEEDITAFRAAKRRSQLKGLIAHDCYLINLASPQEQLYRQSVEAFVIEMQRAEALGLDALVTHPGAFVDSTEEAGLQRVAEALDEVHQRCPRCRVRVLLETTAGQGSSLGHRFEHLAAILKRLREPNRVGVCLDTCHVFAAGYALAPRKEYLAAMRHFDRVVGLERIEAFHLNDSQKPLGSRVDRHAHIGRGKMGLEPFRLLVNDRRFRKHPMILETPKGEENGKNLDAINLATLRSLVVKAARSQRSPSRKLLKHLEEGGSP
jgi:deoxyribonuclease-4